MIATGIGSMPGEDFAEAQRIVLGELAEPVGLPYVVELPVRGAGATMIGRTLSLLPLDADLQPAGWRLTGTDGSAGLDQRRARSLLAQDLDTVEELTQGYQGAFKAQLAGPWTLAATVERPRGDKLLADHGARRELAQALAEAARDHVRELRRRISGATRLIIQVDEPALAAVLDAQVPTASGFGRHRRIDIPEASDLLASVLAAIADEGAEPWVHSCAPGVPWGLVRGAGAATLSADCAMLRAADLDELGEALDAGVGVALGVVPATGELTGDKQVTERGLRWLDMLGLDPEEVGERLVITPSCGLAGAPDARAALALARTSAASLNG
ncbi:methionine synthase [Nocardioides sp. Kera G14]|uniref:methionine synthase n=1 Tax=Nocardioides sp. Kera G14 TaxID=2884264 RepID=UPI001D11FA6D|nr:methionine synthase [Nocardioides sp. Kera G14]UDY24516.1 methionine synthase [Nocardioides sp. Kera G14]